MSNLKIPFCIEQSPSHLFSSVTHQPASADQKIYAHPSCSSFDPTQIAIDELSDRINEGQIFVQLQKPCLETNELIQKIQQFQQISLNLTHCPIHHEPYIYDCKTCGENICYQCITKAIKHRGHRLAKISPVDSDPRLILRKIEKCIKNKKDRCGEILAYFISRLESLESNSGKYLCFLDEKMKKYFENLLCEKYNKYQQSNEEQLLFKARKDSLKQFFLEKELLYKKLLQKLVKNPQALIVGGIGDEIQEQISRNYDQFHSLQVDLDEKTQKSIKSVLKNQSFFHPSFQQKEYIVTNFKQSKQKKIQIITKIFQLKRNKWRLKIYPGGYLPAGKPMPTMEYFSIYIERIDGVLDIQTFIVRVELLKVNKEPDSVTVVMRKQFKSQYQKKQSWGYDKFTRVNNLYQNGLVTSVQDELHIRVSIATANFREGCSELTEIIRNKQCQKQRNDKKIKQLTDRLKKIQQQRQNFWQENAQLQSERQRFSISQEQIPTKQQNIVKPTTSPAFVYPLNLQTLISPKYQKTSQSQKNQHQKPNINVLYSPLSLSSYKFLTPKTARQSPSDLSKQQKMSKNKSQYFNNCDTSSPITQRQQSSRYCRKYENNSNYAPGQSNNNTLSFLQSARSYHGNITDYKTFTRVSSTYMDSSGKKNLEEQSKKQKIHQGKPVLQEQIYKSQQKEADKVDSPSHIRIKYEKIPTRYQNLNNSCKIHEKNKIKSLTVNSSQNNAIKTNMYERRISATSNQIQIHKKQGVKNEASVNIIRLVSTKNIQLKNTIQKRQSLRFASLYNNSAQI